MSKQVIVSGVKPSGDLHIGNYLGALKNFLELQKKYTCYFFIADLHSLTEPFTREEKQKQIFNLAVDLLSLGIDPKQSVLFIQSHVPHHLELAWIFNCIAPYQELMRMTQFKDKSKHHPKNINMGLLDYPVLQAADILLYHGALVPVGKDQDQHLELTRLLARKFNMHFGKMFSEPKPFHTETPVIMSLTHPGKKMSKSYGPKNLIALTDEPAVIKQKLQSAVTDTGKEHGEAMSQGVANLFILLENFSEKITVEKFKKAHANGSIHYKELKEKLAEDIALYFKPFRDKRKKLLQKPEYVAQMYSDGANKARSYAHDTMQAVRNAIGIT